MLMSKTWRTACWSPTALSLNITSSIFRPFCFWWKVGDWQESVWTATGEARKAALLCPDTEGPARADNTWPSTPEGWFILVGQTGFPQQLFGEFCSVLGWPESKLSNIINACLPGGIAQSSRQDNKPYPDDKSYSKRLQKSLCFAFLFTL